MKGEGELANVYRTGSTVTLRATFKDINGTPTNAEGVPTVTVYDKNFNPIGVPFSAVQEGTGKYKFDYQIPDGTLPEVYYYEFKATLVGNVALNRDKFFARFG